MKIFTKEFGYKQEYRSRLRDQEHCVSSHIHQYSELIYVIDGELDLSVDGRKETACSGDAVIIAPFRIHEIRTIGRAKFFTAVFSASCVPNYTEDTDFFYNRDRAVFHPSAELTSMLNDFTKDIPVYQTQGYTEIPRKLKSLLYLSFCEYTERVPDITSIQRRDVLSSLFLYINEHYTEPITLISVAKTLGYNPKYISQCLSSIPDMNFALILNSLRIDRAKQLLANEKMKIIDIAYECGFNSEQSFHRTFLKQVKITPGEYRKRMIGK